MFIWHQTRGALMRDGELLGFGYSGNGYGYNNPAAQVVKKVGPIPQGKYTIDPSCTDAQVGPCAMRLVPDPTNLMFGRSGFFIHGDNAAMNRTASEGCIVLSRTIRELIAGSSDFDLTVIA